MKFPLVTGRGMAAELYQTFAHLTISGLCDEELWYLLI